MPTKQDMPITELMHDAEFMRQWQYQDFETQVAKAVEHERVRRNLTQLQLAAGAGVDPMVVYRLENLQPSDHVTLSEWSAVLRALGLRWQLTLEEIEEGADGLPEVRKERETQDL